MQQNSEKTNESESNLYQSTVFQKPGFWVKCANFFTQVFNLRGFILSNFIFKPPKKINYKFERIEDKLQLYLRKNVENNSKDFFPVEVPNGYQLFPFLLSYKVKSRRQVPVLYLINNGSENNNLIIYSHGNASDISDVYFLMLVMSRIFNVDVLAYDYSGYGISQGNISEISTYDDIFSVLSFAVQKLKYQLSDIILWGFSLGSGPTIELASRFQNLGGVILQAPLASMNVWIDKNAQWNYDFINGDVFCNINKIENVNSKILIIHGKNDNIINHRHSKLLYERYIKSNKPYKDIRMFLVDDAGHNELHELIFDFNNSLCEEIYNFIENSKDSSQEQTLEEVRTKSLWNEDYRLKQRLIYLEKELKSINLWTSSMEIIGEVRSLFHEASLLSFYSDEERKKTKKEFE